MAVQNLSPTPLYSLPSADWTSDELGLIRDTVAKDATEDEMKLFLYTAQARGLNPLLKEIYFIKRKQKRGDRWVEVGTIQTGIDGFRVIANRTRQLKGVERGVRREENGKLYGWARVWRKDWEHPAYEEVSLDEYKGDTMLWNRMPEQMLKKCAEVAALRMAFSEDLGGIYSHEEMEQAEKSPSAFSSAVSNIASLEDQNREITRQNMRRCLNAITQLQADYGLTQEEMQWVTGLETFKGATMPVLETALKSITEFCKFRSEVKVEAANPSKKAVRGKAHHMALASEFTADPNDESEPFKEPVLN